jgi:N-acetylmuramoyl-L-alanine amidase
MGFGAMESVRQTKLRLIGEAIQSNIGAAKGIKAKASQRSKRVLPVWLWGALFLAGVAAVPSLIVSRGKASSPPGLKAVGMAVQASIVTEAPKVETLPEPPRPLNRAVFPLSIKKIVIDPGHGGKQTGAISESGVAEKEITLDIGLRLRRLMEQASFDVMMTRQTDQSIPLEERVAFANAKNADIFVSIHVNWMEPRELRPLETYYVGPTDDPALTHLASFENRESGYSLSDYRRLLEQVYMDTRRDESRRLAKMINGELYRALTQVNPVLENRGVKTAPFIVLIGTQMPAILVEVSCLSNEDEVKLLTSPDYREKIAQALLRGIRSYADNLMGSDRKGS